MAEIRAIAALGDDVLQGRNDVVRSYASLVA